ncbi:metallophosphoesterase [Romboutsia sp.]|uniref:metallophosphoesterase n=1 Tax=Romboutsia sp. TaxID=1965302 RepID=UPI003F2BB9B6
MIWVVGDIHGMFDPLNELVNEIRSHEEYNKESEQTKIIFLGDYIDHGPSSKEVIDLLLEIKEEFEVVFLAGNHDDMITQYINETDLFQNYASNWIKDNGVKQTLISLSSRTDLQRQLYGLDYGYIKWEELNVENKYVEFFKNLKYSHVEELKSEEDAHNFIFTHACINSEQDILEQIQIKSYDDLQQYLKDKRIWIENSIIWNRKMLKSPIENYINVHGHTATIGLKDYYNLKGNYDTESGMPYFNFGDKKVFCKCGSRNCSFYDVEIDELASINIDTSAIFGKYLTAIKIPNSFAYSKEIDLVQIPTGGSRRNNNNKYIKVKL